MPLHPYLIQAAFIIMGVALLIITIPLKKEGFSFLGKPTIDPILFYTGKIALFSGWGFFLYRSIEISTCKGYGSSIAEWIAAIILCIATMILIFAFNALGKSLRVGLPNEETKLQTTGIYRFSRNPLYLGVFMVSISSSLYYPDIFNIILASYGIFVHYKITLAEEHFLEERFGEEWIEYKRRVRRFI